MNYLRFMFIISVVLLCMVFTPDESHSAKIEKLYLDLSFAPPHNEVVGVREVDRYKASLGLRFSFFESKKGFGVLGAELLPNYYWGGYWPEQTDKWTAGSVQRLEIDYRVFIRPLKYLEIYTQHYENIIVKDGELEKHGYNQRLHNLIGIRFWIIED
ncbi:MAG: hypothetical protein HYS21_11280 [Deltaproteobacteria bacterium]|nr:hypothetical protein [Deltaproteobacteria bacterium]